MNTEPNSCCSPQCCSDKEESTTGAEKIRAGVRDSYAAIAREQQSGCASGGGCCAATASLPEEAALKLGYSAQQIQSAAAEANLGLGCGNPQAIAEIKPGETVVDLGSGAGFDVFLAAEATGPDGLVLGIDMTPEMISRARINAEKLKVVNVEFRLGEIEALPLADESINVIISNCVINLSPEKAKVFNEAFRVLKPGGRLAISDIVGSPEEKLKKNIASISSCIGGASSVFEIEQLLTSAGFEQIKIRPRQNSAEILADWSDHDHFVDRVFSATIEAIKP